MHAEGVTALQSLDEVLAAADFLSLHVPNTDSTRNMIGREQLALMKPDAVIINAARGTVIDEEGMLCA